MATLGYNDGKGQRPTVMTETAAVRDARLARERADLEEARDELRQGLGLDIDDPDVATWLDGLDGDEDLPLPEPRKSPRPGF